MGAGFSYQGASGDLYHFQLTDTINYRTLPWHGAVIVFAERAPEPIQIMEVDNLYGAMMNLQSSLKEQPHILTYVLPEDDATRRGSVVQDLLENHPAMTRL